MNTAEISPDQLYRYVLTRWLDAGQKKPRTITFIGLNPSTADARQDDPTIRRISSFARGWGYDRLRMLNLYAYRTAHPSELLVHPESVRVGPLNDERLREEPAKTDAIVCAWGALATPERVRTVLELLGSTKPLLCIGYTMNGNPRHPLYMPGDSEPVPYRPC